MHSNADMDDVEVLQVPTSLAPADLAALCQRYRASRLRALQIYPRAFSSTYKRESAFTDAEWIQRLSNPMSTTFVAVSAGDHHHPTPTVERLKNNDWVGMVVLLGPKAFQPGPEVKFPWDPFLAATGMTPEPAGALVGAEAAYLVASMYVLPESTRRGIGQRLMAGLVARAKEDAGRVAAKKLCVSLIVEHDHFDAVRLYQKFGFRRVDVGSALDGIAGRTIAPLGMAWSADC